STNETKVASSPSRASRSSSPVFWSPSKNASLCRTMCPPCTLPPVPSTFMEDEVDRIVDAWRRERPDRDPAPLHEFSRISRLARHLELARRAAFTSRGLEPWSFDVLSALRRAGAPYELTPGVLMSQTLVSSGTMTNRVDRLVAAGLVERHGRPGDRRVVV